MRKKSHILLARYLADQMQTTASLQSHRKAFCLGSILPDIKPSFLTKRHEFFGTFDEIKDRMRELMETRLAIRECTGGVLEKSFTIWQIILPFLITGLIQAALQLTIIMKRY